MTWETVPFNRAFVDVTRQSPKVKQREFASAGRFPVVDQGVDDVAGFWDDPADVTRVARPLVLFGDHTRRVKYATSDFVMGADGVKALAPCPQLEPRFAFWWLSALSIPSAGYSRHFKFLQDRHVPIPQLAEQRRIAAILDEADSVRRRQLDAFTAFRRLADRVADERLAAEYAQLVPLGNIATISSGITKGRPAPQGPLTLVPMLTVANVQDKALDLTLVREIEVSEREIDRYRVRPGDLLLTEGGDPDKLGRGVVWNAELDLAIHQNHVFKVRADADVVDSTWLNWEIGSSYGKRYFLRAAKQTTGIATINASQLRAFPVRLVSAASQRAVADIIDAMMTQVHRAERACTSLDALCASLQHRAFRGEL